MTDWIRKTVVANLDGNAVAIPSVCSAHPDVIAAALMLADDFDQPLLIEATSNQVNQFGGYTGMRATDFVGYVKGICAQHDFDDRKIVYGGDHLGPQAWRDQDADAAMERAIELVRSYAQAGFTKIHLDCSQGCAGEPAQLDDEIVAQRAATLADACEKAAPRPELISYVIGTEVPPPGGARSDEADHAIKPTDPDNAAKTLEIHEEAFKDAGLTDAWNRVIATVVQPGLEFGPVDVFDFDMNTPDQLSQALRQYPGICFEAHSTDYQKPDVYAELARRHFAILKVGPALTHAYRKAIYALDHLRGWINPSETQVLVHDVMEDLMIANDAHWRGHYAGNANDIRLMRHFSWADRIRYYWGHAKSLECTSELEAELANVQLPPSIIDQYFGRAVQERAEAIRGAGHSMPKALIFAQIQEELAPYFAGRL